MDGHFKHQISAHQAIPMSHDSLSHSICGKAALSYGCQIDYTDW